MVTQVGDVSQIPLISNGLNEYKISDIGDICLNISKQDWDFRETSWDFQQNELIRCKSNSGQDSADIDMLRVEDRNEISGMAKRATDSNLLEDCYEAYKSKWTEMFFQLHRNEEELNRQFIEIYGLQDELTPDVPLEEITILQEETSIENGELVFHADEVFAQFVSYAVGCMFGRYSLDKPGLILANQGETLQDYLEKVGRREEELTFVPDRDNIIPVLDDEWFRDDIVERFYTFLKASFGEQKLQEETSNLWRSRWTWTFANISPGNFTRITSDDTRSVPSTGCSHRQRGTSTCWCTCTDIHPTPSTAS